MVTESLEVVYMGTGWLEIGVGGGGGGGMEDWNTYTIEMTADCLHHHCRGGLKRRIAGSNTCLGIVVVDSAGTELLGWKHSGNGKKNQARPFQTIHRRITLDGRTEGRRTDKLLLKQLSDV